MAVKRTTIELDQELLARAQKALGQPTARATVEESLRQAADHAESATADRVQRQLQFLRSLPERLDMDVYASDEMWH